MEKTEPKKTEPKKPDLNEVEPKSEEVEGPAGSARTDRPYDRGRYLALV